MQLLKLVLENCVFTFQDKFFKQPHSTAMGSPCSPVVASIYMEYFENIALGPELPLPVKDWKRYVDDVFSIIPKGNRDKKLQYLNSIDPPYKVHHRTAQWGRGHPLPGHLPQTPRRGYSGLQYTENPHTLTGIWTSIPVTLSWQKELW